MLVPEAGLEPAWVYPHAPQTCLPANSTSPVHREASRGIRDSRRRSLGLQVAQDLARRVRAGRAGDEAAGMRAGTAQIEPGDRRPVAREAERGAEGVELVEARLG